MIPNRFRAVVAVWCMSPPSDFAATLTTCQTREIDIIRANFVDLALGGIAEKLQHQFAHPFRLLLLHPMPGPIDEVRRGLSPAIRAREREAGRPYGRPNG